MIKRVVASLFITCYYSILNTHFLGKGGIYIKTFMIQTVDKEVVHDFSFSLIESIKYNNWYNDEKVYDYILQDNVWLPTYSNDQPYKDDVEGIIPIGSVEFVLEYLSKYYKIKNVKPINIPQELMKFEYLKRWVGKNDNDTTIKNIWHSLFIKDKTKIKGETRFLHKNEYFPQGEWLVSEFIDIKSEWRAFVFNNQLVGLQYYQGDFTLFPDVDLINEMICDYKDKNSAYTLDVGVNYEKGTFLIECHDFFSCGLYGFADHRILPRMFIATWNKLTNRREK